MAQTFYQHEGKLVTRLLFHPHFTLGTTLKVSMNVILLKAKIKASELRNVNLDAVEWAGEYSAAKSLKGQ